MATQYFKAYESVAKLMRSVTEFVLLSVPEGLRVTDNNK